MKGFPTKLAHSAEDQNDQVKKIVEEKKRLALCRNEEKKIYYIKLEQDHSRLESQK